MTKIIRSIDIQPNYAVMEKFLEQAMLDEAKPSRREAMQAFLTSYKEIVLFLSRA